VPDCMVKSSLFLFILAVDDVRMGIEKSFDVAIASLDYGEAQLETK
jgi:hypothetical protein